MRITDKDLRICLIAYTLTAVSLAWGHDSGPEYIETFDTTLEIRESGAPVRDSRHFVDLLPYAVALDAEEAWRERAAGVDDGEADRDTADVLAWYREVQRCHDTAAAMVPIIAAASGATAATGAGAAGGASAGGV